MKSCVVCKADNSKYKCPHCRAYYCSINCNSAHKEVCSSSSSTAAGDLTVKKSMEAKVSHASDEFRNKLISEELLNQLDNSQDICDALKSAKLRKVISEIDSIEVNEARVKRLRIERETNDELNSFLNLLLKELEA